MLKSALIAAPMCIVASLSAYAAENPEAFYVAMATELFQSLPKNSTVAIQPLSEDETKIPSSILRSIEVGLTSALQRGSDFEVKLIARDRLQTIWKEAREFSNKKFEDMVAEAGAEVLLIGEVRPNADGIEISYRAFRVKGSGTGNVIASSKPRVMAMDWKKELGAAPTQIADTMKEMAEAMKRLAASGGLVAEPKTPADFYHNARILSQRGETDLAMEAYNTLIKDGRLIFVDPILDAINIARKLYGADSVAVYVEKKIKPFVSPDLAMFAAQIGSEKPLIAIEQGINNGQLTYPPLLAAFVASTNAAAKFSSSTGVMGTPYGIRMAVYKAAEVVTSSYREGVFQSFYFDPIRAEQVAKSVMSVLELDSPQNRFYYRHGGVEMQYSFKKKLVGYQVDPSPSFTINDNSLDPKAELSICYIDISRLKRCIQPLANGAVVDVSAWSANIRNINFGIGSQTFLCAVEVSWHDTRGGFFSIDARELHENSYSPESPNFKKQEIEKENAAGFFKECISGIAKTDVEIKAEIPKKEAEALQVANEAKIAELQSLGSNEAEFKAYVVKERELKRFINEEILLGSNSAKGKLPITLGKMAKNHLDLREGIENTTRSAFHENVLEAMKHLKGECFLLENFSPVKRGSRDKEGYCIPTNGKVLPALVDKKDRGQIMIFESVYKGKISTIDDAWNEPISTKGGGAEKSNLVGFLRTNEETMAMYIEKERSFKQFLGEEILLGNSAIKSQLANRIGELAKGHLKLRDALKDSSQLNFGELYVKEVEKLKQYCSNIIFLAGGSKRGSVDSDGFCKPTNPSGAPGLINPKDSSVVFSFESSFGGKIGSIDAVWNEPVLADRVGLANSPPDGVGKKRSDALTGSGVSSASTLVSEEKVWATVGGWKVIRSLDFDGCITTNSFKDETDVVFGYSAKTDSYVVSLLNPKWNIIKLDKVEKMSYKMSSGVKFSGEFKVGLNGSGNTVIQSAVNRKFIDALAKEKSFQISAKGLLLGDISLRNSSKAIDAVKECQRDLEGVLSNTAPASVVNSIDERKPKKPAPKQSDNSRELDPLSIMRALTGGQRLPF